MARYFIELADTLVHRANEVVVLGIPERNQDKLRAQSANIYLEATAEQQQMSKYCGSTEVSVPTTLELDTTSQKTKHI